MRRYVILLAAVLMQMCLGATYSWSVYVQPLKQMTDLLQGTVQLPFTLFYFAFPATMLFSGSLLTRIGPRKCAIIGGLFFGGGWLLAGAGEIHFLFTLAGIGLVAGIGAGFGYIVPISTCIQWFPKHKGLVTGIAVSGFGGGAALISQISGHLMQAYMYTAFDLFSLLGLAFLIIIVLAGSVMKSPKLEQARKGAEICYTKLIRQKVFWILYLAMFAGLAAGFAVNANLKELYAQSSLEAGIAAVSIFAIANALGRIVWGVVFDRIISAAAIQFNLIFQALILLCAAFLLVSDFGLLIFAALTGFNYGGVLTLYASTVARAWGREAVGKVYGLLFSSNIPAALAPMLAGFGYDYLNSFLLPLGIIGLFLLGAALAIKRSSTNISHSNAHALPSTTNNERIS
jgi:OFA family oxalate/formate antiporter-like MFS transporter